MRTIPDQVLQLPHKLALAALPSVTTALCLTRLHNGWAAILAYHAVIVVSVARWSGKQDVRPPGKTWKRIGGVGFLVGLLTGPALYLLLPFVTGDTLDRRLAENGLAGLSWQLFVPYFALVNPVLEELFWRELLRTPGREGLALDALFAAYHLFVLALFVAPSVVVATGALLLTVSLSLRALAASSGSIRPCVACHIAADIGIIVAVALRR